MYRWTYRWLYSPPMLRLDLRHYETVVAIVELGTMTEAARHLATTQSALSHRLAEAERRLGTTLFTRGPQRRLKPTRAGLAIHQSASRALADLERTESLLVVDGRTVTATVRIAVGSYDCYYWFPELLAEARTHFPDIDLELVVGGDAPGQALAAGAVDVVVAPGEPAGAVTRIELFQDELVLIVHPSHPLAEHRWVTAEELADEAYLTYNPNPTPGFEYDRFIRPTDTYPRMVTVVQQTSAITELVAAAAGVSILSRWALAPAIDTGRVVPVRCGQDGLPLMWSGVIRSEEPADSPVRSIVELLAAHVGPRPQR